MAAFQDTREQTEQKVMIHLFSEIERNSSFKQRILAAKLGIALGLMNQYLKRCVTKGWVRASHVSPRRIMYFLTPEGFKEKSLMVADYLGRSLTFFRDAKFQCEEVFSECERQGWKKIAFVGEGEIADIAKLVASGTSISGTVSSYDNLKDFDAVVITDVADPQGTYNAVKDKVEGDRLFLLDVLHISPSSAGEIK
jgi:hypothetical protein